MIQLKRVRLINWHNFVNDTLTFEKITYLIGVNAVGKTTILDAIRYCLTTNKNFNALGNRKSARTLQGFVHGKQRGENAYTRRGHTVSYVGVEFWDQKQNKSFVITARVESESPEQELRHVRQSWYLSPMGICLEDLPFLDPNTNAPSSREQFSISNGKMPSIDRQTEAKNLICQRLGIGKADSPLGKKFSSVFPMGTSLDEINDFRTFIYEYILPQPVVDLETLQRDERELENLQETLMQAQRRAQQLREIVDLGEQAREKERDVCINQGFILHAQYQADAMEQAQLSKKMEECRDQLQRLELQYEEARQREENLHAAYQQAWKAFQDSDEGKFLETLRQRATSMKNDLAALRKRVSECRNLQGEITDLLRRSSKRYPVREELYPDAIRKQPERSQQQLLAELADQVSILKDKLEQTDFQLRDQANQLRIVREELEIKIRQLEKGQWLYPDRDGANVVRNAINEALVAQGMEADAKVLCELLYMNDGAWQDCVETCLGYRRFDILVSPEHYETAKRVFEDLGESVGRVSLLDSRALYRDRNREATDENTLAAKVSSENPLARAYVRELLGGIVCCEDSSVLEDYPNSATRDLLRHYPYRLARLKRQEHFIGREARKQQLEEAKKQHRQAVKQGERITKESKTVRELLDLAQSVVHRKCVATVREHWNCEQEFQELTEQFTQLQHEIEQWENDPILRGLQSKEERMKTEWEAQQSRREELAGKKNVWQDKLLTCEGSLQTIQSREEVSLQNWKEFVQENPQLASEVEAKYAEASTRRTPGQIVTFQTNYQRQLENARDSFVNNQLIPAQRRFNQEYSCDILVGFAGVEDFRAQHEQLVQIDLERYSASLQKAKERCRERFRKDILYRMKDDIQNARRQFRDLSRIMQELRYGEEVYQFRVRESQDPEMGRLYRLIMNEQNSQTTAEDSLFNLVAMDDPVYEAQIDEFVEQILSAAKETVQERQKGRAADQQMIQLVDYRQYLDYDIIITNIKTGESVPLSKVSQDSSGGENQAPFYIAICASLLQIYQKCENSIRLVLLDEAFSKMTSDRIKPMMQMFCQMELQVVLITTVEKASAIYPMCDVTYSIVKSGSRNAVAPFYLEVRDRGV
jgi:hypothetical protein